MSRAADTSQTDMAFKLTAGQCADSPQLAPVLDAISVPEPTRADAPPPGRFGASRQELPLLDDLG